MYNMIEKAVVQDVKAAADIIAATNEEDGVAAELEKMLKLLN